MYCRFMNFTIIVLLIYIYVPSQKTCLPIQSELDKGDGSIERNDSDLECYIEKMNKFQDHLFSNIDEAQMK